MEEKVLYLFEKPYPHIVEKTYTNMLDPFIDIMRNKRYFLTWYRKNGSEVYERLTFQQLRGA